MVTKLLDNHGNKRLSASESTKLISYSVYWNWFTFFYCSKGITFSKFFLKRKGWSIWIQVYIYHRTPQFWKIWKKKTRTLFVLSNLKMNRKIVWVVAIRLLRRPLSSFLWENGLFDVLVTSQSSNNITRAKTYDRRLVETDNQTFANNDCYLHFA